MPIKTSGSKGKKKKGHGALAEIISSPPYYSSWGKGEKEEKACSG